MTLVDKFTLSDLEKDEEKEKGERGARGHSYDLWERCKKLPECGIPDDADVRPLGVHEGCGADEDVQMSRALASDDSDDSDSDESDNGDNGDGNNGSGSDGGGGRTPVRLRQKKCAPPPTLEEREARNLPVREDVFARWLVHGYGTLAQDMRATLVRRAT